ncbi:signal transduction histidine kinase [Actinocrispum wychmicini]|uniref:histidine kinase n=1 Tax=Actinocrispum wychmicini TaxID=1213861 RepID=A0A4R2K449_9PSEU|nr:signal transduction histidine kinase [Actinocrispum wychmicini]
MIDLVITVVVTAATVVPVALTAPWDAIALAVLASAPVVWVWRAPQTVGLVVGVATTVLASVYTPLLLPAGPLLVIYVIAAESTPMWRAVCALATVVGVTISLVASGDDDFSTYRYLAAAYIGAYALGTSTRARRAQARVVAEERAAAAARERTRIAQDMHDIITHSVGMMVVQAEAGPLVVHADPARAAAAFDAIAETGRGAIASLREVVAALRTVGVGSVRDLVARMDGAMLEVLGEPRPISSEVDMTVYRVVQESLTNAMRHAAARTVRVRLQWHERTLGVDVVDDGRGQVNWKAGGYGLIGMRERVMACGGTLHTGPGPGGVGFAVHATLPIG